MIIDYDGHKYTFDMDDITVKQGLKVEKFMGCSFTEWGKRLQAGDLQARQALGWLILHPDGDVAIEDTDFKMVKLGAALDAAYAAEAEAAGEGEPVPTVAVSNGQMPEGSSPESLQPFSGVISR